MLNGEYWSQEVRCPCCSHFFMTMNFASNRNSFLINNQTQSGWFEICPKCRRSLIMIENDSEGKRETDCVHLGDWIIY